MVIYYIMHLKVICILYIHTLQSFRDEPRYSKTLINLKRF